MYELVEFKKSSEKKNQVGSFLLLTDQASQYEFRYLYQLNTDDSELFQYFYAKI